ncbi:MAG: tripartite tricarboxylate transporter substrate binding protein, partial [Boseongicola sp. SB0673_bin_14]|nr:tripartite tricarboxylate transporter substrate binding protein [Boseongicola sp. SB0673_bin_14]
TFLATGAALAATAALPVAAADWQPRRPINLVVPYPPGGGTSTYGRALIGPLSDRLGVPVNIVNKPGAGGVNGATEVAAARPDGQTLMVTTGGALVLPSLVKDGPVDPFDSFEIVAQVGGLQGSIVVPANSPHQTLADLIEAIKANPGGLRWAHTGRGAFLHVSGQSFLVANGLEATDVPFKGGAKVRAAVVGGQVDYAIIGVQQNRGFENEMRALALIAPERDGLQPHIPTVAEQGFEYKFVNTPITMFAPAGTPAEVIETVSALVAEIVGSEGYGEEMMTKGLLPAYLGPEDAEMRLRDLAETVRPIIEGIK